MEEHSALVYKQRLLPDFWSTMGFIPKGTSVATWYRVLPHLQLGLFTITSSPRKFAEGVVLQCHSASHLTCFVSFHRVHPSYATTQSYSHLQFIQSYKSHSFIHSYNYTFIHQYFHTLMHTQHINNIDPYMVASVTRILFRPYLFKSVFTYHHVMRQVPTNEQLVIIIFIKSVIPSVSWSKDVTNHSFQAVSPKQWTA